MHGDLVSPDGTSHPRGTIIGSDEVFKGMPMPIDLVAKGATTVQRVSLQKIVSVLVDKDIDPQLVKKATVEKLTTVRKLLQDIYLFKQILDKQVTRVALALESHTYPKGANIFAAGDPSENFYLITVGRVEVTIPGKGVVRTLAKGDYFGERGLLFSEPRSATCSAVDEVEVLQLSNSVFTSILGKFKDVLEGRIKLQDVDVKLTDLDNVWISEREASDPSGWLRIRRRKHCTLLSAS